VQTNTSRAASSQRREDCVGELLIKEPNTARKDFNIPCEPCPFAQRTGTRAVPRRTKCYGWKFSTSAAPNSPSCSLLNGPLFGKSESMVSATFDAPPSAAYAAIESLRA
jgi:hypothetical protein